MSYVHHQELGLWAGDKVIISNSSSPYYNFKGFIEMIVGAQAGIVFRTTDESLKNNPAYQALDGKLITVFLTDLTKI